jgi:hypothetical protein
MPKRKLDKKKLGTKKSAARKKVQRRKKPVQRTKQPHSKGPGGPSSAQIQQDIGLKAASQSDTAPGFPQNDAQYGEES